MRRTVSHWVQEEKLLEWIENALVKSQTWRL